MLPKIQRPRTKTVHYTLRHGKKRYGKRLTITWISQKHSHRRGVHITKKVAKHATQRNAAKRAIYDSIIHATGQSVSGGVFFVTVNRKYTDQWMQLIEKNKKIPIYNQVLHTINDDITSFINHYTNIKKV